ncbi:uL11 family ribosomal protein [Lyticum sinuosum]|uniref:Large ribosomal subunit protein uL11 n=1 Tax=Lyticum sinuosum TaxID=1332059 RepID=A0AAE4VK67_9RICK|nr:50S ribosomal protein L11 [Lyticum sinuosum]MDZ5761030.1 50S ribosomal protein L11 [Lyticum sinuosum]
MLIKGKISGTIRLVIPSGKATPAPPIGPALAQKKLNIQNFCKEFNERSLKMYEITTPLVVVITAYTNNTYTFIIKNPPTSYLVLKKFGKGLSTPNKIKGPDVSIEELRSVAKIKMSEMMVRSEDAALACVVGMAKSAGLNIIYDESRSEE